MDKNKSIFKLKGIGPIYYINLDDQVDRKDYMESQFKYWGVENYERISAYDGRDDDLSDIIKGKYPDTMTSGEVGCVTSHLKAISHWFENSDSPYAVIMEDDCDISLVNNWPFTWKGLMSRVPYDWDVFQLAIINPQQMHLNMHIRFVNDFSTACYVITRHHAEKLIKFHVRGNKYKLDNGVAPRAVADDLIYNSGKTYAMPVFSYQLKLGSSIHPDHVDQFHKSSRDAVVGFWKENGSTLDVNNLFKVNPYGGGLPNVQQGA